LTNYEVLLSRTARRHMADLPPEIQERVKEKLRELKNSPYKAGPKMDIKKLKGPKRFYYRIRIGDLRAIYVIDGNRVLIAKILPRDKAYDWID
jgi:mRNA-degrading endonuclease RelE of RelBE toxin-antitoxin system